MASATDDSVMAVQKKGQEAATAERNTTNTKTKKWMKWFGISTFLFFLLGWITGDIAEWSAHEKKEASVPAARSSSPAPAIIDGPVLGQTYTMSVSDGEWSKAIRVIGTQCIRWWGENPDGKAFAVSVRGVNDATWYVWEEFCRLKALGKIPYTNPGWYRFQSTSGTTTVMYTIGPAGTCT